jgi:hypothetical protein
MLWVLESCWSVEQVAAQWPIAMSLCKCWNVRVACQSGSFLSLLFVIQAVKPAYLVLHSNKFICSRVVIHGQTDGQGETNRRIFCNFAYRTRRSGWILRPENVKCAVSELCQGDCRNASCSGAAVTVLVALWDSRFPYSVTTCETRILNSCMH